MKVSLPRWWFTAAEIAQLGLPGVPGSARSVRERLVTEIWSRQASGESTTLARPRRSKGGGTEYHASLLPMPAQEELGRLRKASRPTPIAANDHVESVQEAWARFDRQPEAIKAKAVERIGIMLEVESLLEAGELRTEATATVAQRHDISARAIADWFKLVAGLPRSHWLPHLAPKYRGGGKRAEINDEIYRLILSDWLQNQAAAFSACYRRWADEYARPRGIDLPHPKTLLRRLKRDTPKRVIVARREGREALRKTVPAVRRSVAGMHAMQAVNVDGHTFDVFVQWEDGKIGRPCLVGVQDIYSRKLLGWELDRSENTCLTRLAFARVFRDWGIPLHAYLDNGRAFASKALTGGTKTRYRFKIKDTDALGVLPALGIDVHWTKPYSGRSKPIERAWRDLCEEIAKHPALAGAYTGNSPAAKPDDYGSRAIPIDEFRAIVENRIAAHNARPGRRTEMAKGDSFDATFAASYERSPIGMATPEQLRMALLAAEDKKCAPYSGKITLAGNEYWCEELVELAGEKVSVRCDPDNLHSEIHVYRRENGDFVCTAPIVQAYGFADKAGAEQAARLQANARRKVREAEEALNLVDASRLAQLSLETIDPAPRPQPGVTRIVPRRGHTAGAVRLKSQAAPASPDFIRDLHAGATRALKIVE